MRTQRHRTLTIQTPEGVSFAYQLAGPLLRLQALLIDKLVILALTTGVIIAAMLLAWPLGLIGNIAGDLVGAVAVASFFVISTAYGILLEWRWGGQTIGKRALKLRVMDAQGLDLDLFQVVMRNLLRVVDSTLPFIPVGGIVMFLSRHHQRIGDLAANTIVISIPRNIKPDLDAIMSDKYNSFREVPHLAARLRQLVGPQEAHIALRALIRRNLMDDHSRTRLFHEMAEYYRSLVTFPEAVTLGLSDERYVQNVLDVVYRDEKK